MSQAKRILVGQSGGPTSAINASLAGVIAGAREKGVRAIGMRYGIQGFLDGRTVDLDQAVSDDDALALLRDTPASWLGSCRFKLPEPEADPGFFARALERIDAAGVSAVLYIGGNDSMDTIAKLARYGEQVGSDVRFVGVPKTIDNDLVGTDHTPGYGSAARFVATAVAEVARDADVYDLKSVTFVEIMGRDAGWLAGSACLANPDVVLLPEVPLDEDALMAKVGALFAEKNTVMVATSEGVRDASGRLIAERTVATGTGTDEFGHLAQLSGASRYLAALAKGRLGCKTRAVEISTFQRCASHCASATDLDEAFALGRLGALSALDGKTGVMCAVERTSDDPYRAELRTVGVADVANKVKPVPREWIAADGMGVTPEFVRYVRPLVAPPEQIAYECGLPRQMPPLA